MPICRFLTYKYRRILKKMRAVLQRVKKAELYIESKPYSKIEKGLLVLLCVCKDDTEKDLNYMVKKIMNMRIFSDENGKFNLSLRDVKGECMIVSQFTLAADTKKGNRPSYFYAQEPEKAKLMYEKFIEIMAKEGIKTAKGIFGASMEIELINNGPVTIFIDSKENNIK